MLFATKDQYPEANDYLGKGENANTVGLAIYRHSEGIIAKILIDEREAAEIAKTGCIYIHIKGNTTFPLRVDVESPFLTPEKAAQFLIDDIATVNQRLTDELMLDRVTDKTTMPQAKRLNMNAGKDLFTGCEFLMMKIVENSANDLRAEPGLN